MLCSSVIPNWKTSRMRWVKDESDLRKNGHLLWDESDRDLHQESWKDFLKRFFFLLSWVSSHSSGSQNKVKILLTLQKQRKCKKIKQNYDKTTNDWTTTGHFNLVNEYAIEISTTKVKKNKFISSLSFESNQLDRSTFVSNVDLKELHVERESKRRIKRINFSVNNRFKVIWFSRNQSLSMNNKWKSLQMN